MDKVKVLTISNPFFGLEGNDVPDPDPVFADDQYIVVTNFDDTEAYITGYVISKEVMDKAVTRSGSNAKLFRFNNYKKSRRVLSGNGIKEVEEQSGHNEH